MFSTRPHGRRSHHQRYTVDKRIGGTTSAPARETSSAYNNNNNNNNKPVGDMVRSLASMSLCKYRSSAHLLKLTRTSVKLTGKLVCDVARLVSIMIISDDVISDVVRPRSTIREDHIDTPYREILC